MSVLDLLAIAQLSITSLHVGYADEPHLLSMVPALLAFVSPERQKELEVPVLTSVQIDHFEEAITKNKTAILKYLSGSRQGISEVKFKNWLKQKGILKPDADDDDDSKWPLFRSALKTNAEEIEFYCKGERVQVWLKDYRKAFISDAYKHGRIIPDLLSKDSSPVDVEE